MQSWCRTWPHNGSSLIRAKQKLLRKHKGACKSSWSQIGSLKSFTLTIPWNLAKPVKISPGIIARLHLTDRKAVRRVKGGTSAVLLQSGLDGNWWADFLECFTYLRNIQDLSSDGKNTVRETFWETILKALLFRLVHWLSITLFLRKTNQESINLERKVLPGLFFGYALYTGGIWKG